MAIHDTEQTLTKLKDFGLNVYAQYVINIVLISKIFIFFTYR